MTRTNSTATIAVAADYADAMMTARRAKNWLFILLLLILVTQLMIFFLLRFNVIRLGGRASVTVPTGVDVDVTTRPAATSTQPAVEQGPEAGPQTQPEAGSTTQPEGGASAIPASASESAGGSGTESRTNVEAQTHTESFFIDDILRYVIPVTDFLGVTLAVVLGVVLLLIVTIMLVGRLIGVSHVTSAFIWCVLLTAMVFPWQAFLLGSYRPARPPRDASPGHYDTRWESDPAFKIPGALYTWEELRRDYNFDHDNMAQDVLKWARFAGFPILAMLLLMMVQAKSSRGLKYALGESEVQVEVTSPVA